MLEEKLNNRLQRNLDALKNNRYPGRGIIIGMSPDGNSMVQVYWIMGRSENSRNRVFQVEQGFVRTKAYDESKVKDPSLIIYYPARHIGQQHIITNGDQTDTIFEALKLGGSFESALATRRYEPDAPNLTPRISGIVSLEHSPYAYQLSILKSFNQTDGICIRQFFNYEKGLPGIGHCIHTYMGDGSPLPSFAGEPYELPLYDSIDRTLEEYWNALDEENRISLLVKQISVRDGGFDVKVLNKYK